MGWYSRLHRLEPLRPAMSPSVREAVPRAQGAKYESIRLPGVPIGWEPSHVDGSYMKDLLGREIPSNTSIRIERDLLAECCWEYGEEALAARVGTLTDEDLEQVQRLALWHRVNDLDPPAGPRLTNAHIEARAVIEFFEGQTRDTARVRRRTRPTADGYRAANADERRAPP